MNTQKERNYLNKSLDKSLSILNLFDSQNVKLTVTEIASEFDKNPSSLYPILHTLEKHGYLRRDEDKMYKLGLAFARKGGLVLEQLDLSSEAKSELEKLRDKAQETVHLGYLNDDEIVYVDKVEYTGGMRMYSSPGKTAPLHATALGKAILAHISQAHREDLLSRIELTSQTEKTITSEEGLRQELRRIREQGYAVDDEEFEEGIRCIASPIHRHNGEVDAAVSITGLSAQMKGSDIEEKADLVKHYARKISARLGHEGDL